VIRILLVDDHPVMRAGLRAAIEQQPDLRVAGEAAGWRIALTQARALTPAVIVLDLNLADGSGWSLLEQLRALGQLPPTLVLSVCDEAVYARRLFRAGARGYLMKEEPLERIVWAIREVHAGRLVASPALTQVLVAEALRVYDPPEAADPPAAGHALSDRELQVFGLLARNLSGKEVAEHLGVSQKTVSTYKTRLLSKLGLRTTPELIARYRELDPGAAESGPL
jgi:DNA-binding NarL/FixJ family response regulator